jgi:hypothetical protein
VPHLQKVHQNKAEVSELESLIDSCCIVTWERAYYIYLHPGSTS